MDIYTLSRAKGIRKIELRETSSTNDYLHSQRLDLKERITIVTAEFQSSGRGATGQWQSLPGENLLFSLLIHPSMVEASGLFILSQTICLSICEALNGFAEGFRIKWPNDIYWGDKKVVGILIENELAGKHVSDCIIGVGVNVNQRYFGEDVPNPTSLSLILRQNAVDRSQMLDSIVSAFDCLYAKVEEGRVAEIREKYLCHLYRKDEEYQYQDSEGRFTATLKTVEPSGHLRLLDKEGRERRYAFKEVQFIV